MKPTVNIQPTLTVTALNGRRRPRSTRGPAWPRKASGAGSFALGSAATVALAYARSRYLRWGATPEEVHMGLPGDRLLLRADLSATRAVSIDAPAAAVWPWLLQLGQGRGGFYSYDALENLVGLNIHSADRIVPEWQALDIGATVDFASGVGMRVAELAPDEALVLRGGMPMARTSPYDFTWAFVLHPGAGDTTRLIVRERYAYLSWWAPLLVEPVEVVSSVMSPKMLRGIRDRAERVTVVTASSQLPETAL